MFTFKNLLFEFIKTLIIDTIIKALLDTEESIQMSINRINTKPKIGLLIA